jgi:Ca2+/H+ antiporter, TMEM165/GDT1 family
MSRLCRRESEFIMNLSLLASVYAIIFLAELPDKTALASLFLATRHRPLPVFLGACLALAVQSAVAVAFGHVLSLFPAKPVHLVAGVIFVGCAVAMWRRTSATEGGGDNTPRQGFLSVLATVFGVVFVAEWGDLTQIGTAALAARYHAPLVVFTGATLALWSVVAIVVFLGASAGRALPPDLTKRVAAVVFAVVGAVLIVR